MLLFVVLLLMFRIVSNNNDNDNDNDIKQNWQIDKIDNKYILEEGMKSKNVVDVVVVIVVNYTVAVVTVFEFCYLV